MVSRVVSVGCSIEMIRDEGVTDGGAVNGKEKLVLLVPVSRFVAPIAEIGCLNVEFRIM